MIPEATIKGYDIACEGDYINLSYLDSLTRRGRVGKQCSQTLLCNDNNAVVVANGIYTNDSKEFHAGELMDLSRTIKANNHDTGVVIENRFYNQAFETIREKECNIGDTINAFNKTVDRSGISPTLTTRPDGFKTAILPVCDNLRIRKLTPLECWRLMGFDDEDFYKAAKVDSNSQLYKQAGNSIVVDVLYYIFKEFFI